MSRSSRSSRIALALLACACGERSATPAGSFASAPSPASASAAPATPETPSEAEPPSAPVSLWVAGDILLSEAVRDSMHATDDPAGAYARVLQPVAELWNADPGAFVLVNLETPVAARRRHAWGEGHRAREPGDRGLTPVYLQGPPWLPEALARAGVDAVMLANNHALDQDREGLAETIAAAHRAGLVVTGAGPHPRHRWPILLGHGDRSMAVLSFYDAHDKFWVEEGEAARSFLDDEAPVLVADAAARHHAVVVVVHFVGELVREPKQRWRERVARLVEAGADVVLGHGTHVPMRVERVGGVPVAWGLGNFAADMGRQASPRRVRRDLPKIQSPETREGLVARVRMDAEGELDLAFLPVWNGDDRFIRWHTERRAGEAGEEVVFRLSPLAPCGPALELPALWPEPWRSELARWVDDRRNHLVAASGLEAEPCSGGRTGWLRMARSSAEAR